MFDLYVVSLVILVLTHSLGNCLTVRVLRASILKFLLLGLLDIDWQIITFILYVYVIFLSIINGIYCLYSIENIYLQFPLYNNFGISFCDRIFRPQD